ncbi:hypothetical protein GCM10017783_05020 [Deinococcus piscis]|uniref:Protein-glutamine gamma-glutamyltransferase-like C-terminal domain-containing protein n=1 Tax=Deinococcus piscis TaxID=394230 RepID=A0ABQ3JZA1_9DEIO|nr:DUF4129 domain-containing protein [Deinococcus piscis]GHF96147.1 hypothetical protein GCM10017783_05020 [Deinococcus piscis]
MTQAQPAAWRTAAFAALPLVLAGLLPALPLLGLVAVFALTAREDLRLYRTQLSLGVLATNLLVTLWLAVQGGDQRYMVAAFFLIVAQMALAFLVVQAAERAEEAWGHAWLWLLPAFALAPHPLGLVSLGAAALLRRSDDDRALPDRWQAAGQRRAWPWLAGAAALAVLAGVLLPRASLWEQAAAYMGVTEQVTVVNDSPLLSRPDLGEVGERGGGETPTFSPEAPEVNQTLSRAAAVSLEVLGVAVMLACMVYAVVMLRAQLRRPGLPPRWPQVWPLLALLALPLTLLAVAVAAQFRALDITVVDGARTPAPPPPDTLLEGAVQQVVALLAATPLGNLNLYHALFLLLVALLLFTLLAWGWHLLTSRPQPTFSDEVVQGAEPVRAAGPSSAPLHRVRQAYAQVERHLSAAGQYRRASETPAEYLRRVAGEWPEVAGPLATLGTTYGAVRYGSGVSERQADQAEQSAAAVLGMQWPEVRR